jgi:APA family basic amino acid/polyamine antiporter
VRPFVPPHSVNPETNKEFVGGFAGVIRGAPSSFFGYLGYDEVCCVAGEAINPSVNVPRAVMLTIMGAATLYVMATAALTGMQPYELIR